MKDLAELIDRASKVAGSDKKLSELIDSPQPHMSQWRKGARPCPPADVALMADIAGLNADEWALRAVAAKYEGTEKGEKLKRALKVSAATIGAVLSSGVHAGTIGGDVLRCIFCEVMKRWLFMKTQYNAAP